MGIEFNGEFFNDDRMFVLCLCKSTTERQDGGVEITTIYHDEAPDDHRWSVVTYWNVPKYRPFRIDNFETLDAAAMYFQGVSPTTPRISFGGQPPPVPISFEEHRLWMRTNNLVDYDIDSINPREGVDHKRMEMFYNQR